MKTYFDEMFDEAFDMVPLSTVTIRFTEKHGKNLMKTDVRETDESYELDIDLPGFKKDEISAQVAKRLSDHQRSKRAWIKMKRIRKAAISAENVIWANAAEAFISVKI